MSLQEHLIGSEQFYRRLVETMSVGLGIQDARGRLTYANNRLCEIWGYGREEILGKSVIDFVDGSNREAFLEQMEKRRQGEEHDYEIEFVKKDGGRVVAIVLPRVMRDEEGCYAGSFAVVTDITERKQMEEAIAYAADHFIRSSLWRRDIQEILGRLGTAMDVSSVRIFQRWGDGSGDSKAALLFEWAAPGVLVATGDRSLQEFSMREAGLGRWAELFEGDGTISGDVNGLPLEEQRFLSRHGILSVAVAPIFVSSRWWGMLVFNEHRSVRKWSGPEIDSLKAVAETLGAAIERGHAEEELQTSEENYRELVENANSIILKLDTEGSITFFNEFAQRFFGYREDEVLGRNIIGRIVVGADPAGKDMERMVEEILTDPDLCLTNETESIKRDGERIWVAWTYKAILGDEGELTGILAIGNDISQRKRVEDELKERQVQLRDFLNIAAHELRHPITVINGYTKTFMEHLGSLSPGTLEHILKALDMSSNRLIQITDSLLDVARVEQETLRLEITEISLSHLLERALEEMRAKGMENVVEVTAPPGEVLLTGDIEKLVRVMVVLLDNAAKFAPGHSALEVQATREDTRLLISVLDRGRGVPEEAVEKVFDRFYQVEGVDHHSTPGLGFGLYIARVTVEAHGGRIWFEPREGGGSIFRVSLPLA